MAVQERYKEAYQEKREIDFDNMVSTAKINKECIKQSQLLFEYFSNKDENDDLNIVNQKVIKKENDIKTNP